MCSVIEAKNGRGAAPSSLLKEPQRHQRAVIKLMILAIDEPQIHGAFIRGAHQLGNHHPVVGQLHSLFRRMKSCQRAVVNLGRPQAEGAPPPWRVR